MSFNYTADEIFEMALQIERNGAAFYEEAAARTTDPRYQKLLKDIAAMEVGHQTIFAEMRSELGKKEKTPVTFDPNGEAVQYLRALADMRVFFHKEINLSSLDDIFKAAITAEKESILFYLGMKDLVPAQLGSVRIDAIIDEEKRHIRILSDELAAYRRK